MIRVVALLALLAAPVQAQELSVDPQRVYACLAATPEGQGAPDCLGQASNDCQMGPGGQTTPGIAACIASETAVWDDILNAEYTATRGVLSGQSAPLADSLRDAQRAWIAFRDAECALTYARWEGGSIRSIAYANCLMVMTAERALALRDIRPR